MKGKYIRPQVVNSDVGKDTATISGTSLLGGRIKFFGAIPSHKLENLPKRKD